LSVTGWCWKRRRGGGGVEELENKKKKGFRMRLNDGFTYLRGQVGSAQCRRSLPAPEALALLDDQQPSGWGRGCWFGGAEWITGGALHAFEAFGGRGCSSAGCCARLSGGGGGGGGWGSAARLSNRGVGRLFQAIGGWACWRWSWPVHKADNNAAAPDGAACVVIVVGEVVVVGAMVLDWAAGAWDAHAMRLGGRGHWMLSAGGGGVVRWFAAVGVSWAFGVVIVNENKTQRRHNARRHRARRCGGGGDDGEVAGALSACLRQSWMVGTVAFFLWPVDIIPTVDFASVARSCGGYEQAVEAREWITGYLIEVIVDEAKLLTVFSWVPDPRGVEVVGLSLKSC
ncbi:hypothetical protein DL93DRAFT_2103809, partial [Clavulina sp. PMI_390]